MGYQTVYVGTNKAHEGTLRKKTNDAIAELNGSGYADKLEILEKIVFENGKRCLAEGSWVGVIASGDFPPGTVVFAVGADRPMSHAFMHQVKDALEAEGVACHYAHAGQLTDEDPRSEKPSKFVVELIGEYFSQKNPKVDDVPGYCNFFREFARNGAMTFNLHPLHPIAEVADALKTMPYVVEIERDGEWVSSRFDYRAFFRSEEGRSFLEAQMEKRREALKKASDELCELSQCV